MVGLRRPGWVLDTSTIARSIHGPGRSISLLGPKMICLGLDFLGRVDYMFSHDMKMTESNLSLLFVLLPKVPLGYFQLEEFKSF